VKALDVVLRAAAKPLPAGRVWLVGGFVRDALLGRPLTDVDLAVQGDPLRAARALGAAVGARPFVLDKERGTYRVMETAKDGRRQYDLSRVQGKGIEEDLRLRDFTVNALAVPVEAWRPKKDWKPALLDLSGGRADLKARRLKFVSEGALKADPLRMMRAFRLAAELEFTIDPKTLAAVTKHRARLRRSAPERVREELMKLLVTPDAGRWLVEMDRRRLLTAVLPEGEAMRKTARQYYGAEGVMGHSLAAVRSLDRLLRDLPALFPEFAAPLRAHLQEPVGGFPRYVLLKLGELLHDVGKPKTAKTEGGKMHFYGHEHVGADLAERIGQRLRLSNDENRTVARLVRGHMRPGNLGHLPSLSDRAVYRFYRDLEGDAVGMLVVSLADHFTYLSDKVIRARKDPVHRRMHEMLSRFFLRRETVHPPKIVDGRALMEKLGVEEGPLVGRLLNAVREAQAAGRVKSPEQALKLAEALLKDGSLAAPPGEARGRERREE
jgi:putative nucleotidyltransferase with HDIG domain